MAAFHEAIPEAKVFVVDNNSSDDTRRAANAALERLACQGAVIFEPRQGKGNAVRRAFLDIDADIYVLADADMTYPASQARVLIAPVSANRADMVVGDRLATGRYASQNRRAFHNLGNRLVGWLINSLFHAHLNDIMSGYRVLSRRFVRNYPILVEGFEIETDMTLHALDKRFRIVEVPIEYVDRPAGSESKLHTFSDGAKVLFTIAQILRYYRPLFFFGLVSLFFLAGACLAGLPAIYDWLRFRYVYHVPLAILASGLVIVSVLLLTIGLILDSLTHHQRRTFEHDMTAKL
jgi:glycosyltransferase involved in cell wall biosynthesis